MKYSKGYENINVKILSITKNPAEIMWDMLKQTWINLQDIPYNQDDKRVSDMIKKSVEKKINPTPLETIHIQVLFEGISRVNLAQLTRHRGWLFNVESQMPQSVNHNIILPLNIEQSIFKDRALKLIEDAQNLYDDMIEGNENFVTTNIPYQDARYLLLHGQTTQASASFTLPQLLNVCGQRLENNTADEINYAFRKLIYSLKNYIYEMFFYKNEIDYLSYFVYMEMLNKCDCFGANAKKSFNHDNVFGNSFERYPCANIDIDEITNNCLLNFRKSAWYFELKRIYIESPELLLPDEKEMIKGWDNICL